jgi:hypothetical protein
MGKKVKVKPVKPVKIWCPVDRDGCIYVGYARSKKSELAERIKLERWTDLRIVRIEMREAKR